MQRLEIKLSNRKGITLVLSALLIVVFIGAAAFAVDVGHMQVRRADVHAASDAAALAGIEEFVATSRGDSALNEAQAFAARFKADTAHLTVAAADFHLGFWSGTAFSAGGTDTNAAQATVRYAGKLTFAPVLFGHIAQHASAATSVAVGIAGKTVTRSSCVSPVVLTYQTLLDFLYGTGVKNTSYNLTASDITTLNGKSAANAITYNIPNHGDLSPGEFVQMNLPPGLYADGTQGNPGNNGNPSFLAGFACTGSPDTVGIGDWIAPLPGQRSGKTAGALSAIGYPATIQVAIADTMANVTNCSGCYRVRYLGVFVATSAAKKSVTGYFATMNAKQGGAVTTGNAVSPIAIMRTHLVF